MPTPTAEDILGEALLWSIGLEAFLKPSPVRLTVERRDRAARVPATMRASLKKYLLTKEFDAPKPERPPFDFSEVRDLLLQEPRTDVALGNVIGFDTDDQALGFTGAATRAAQYLRDRMPTHYRQTATGPKLEDPSAFESAMFSWAWSTANDPEVLFGDMNRGCLSHIQARTFADCYPSLYSLAQSQVFEILTDHAAEHPRFELGGPKERQMLIFLGKPEWSPELVAEMQAAHAAMPAEQSGGAPIDLKSENQQTATQRIANS